MRVRKRDGRVEEFNSAKIERAITGAKMDEFHVGDFITDLEFYIDSLDNEEMSVEEIHSLVENELMSLQLFDTARNYIEYRAKKDHLRREGKEKKYQYLSDDFLSKYKHLPDPLNEIGSFVFYRTYSRFLDSEGRRERWWESVARAVDYNIGLSPHSTREEAEELFDYIYHGKMMLSSRTLFTGGTKVSEISSIQNFNCSYVAPQKVSDFGEIFYVLMLGTGVGAGVEKKYTNNLPNFRQNIDLINKEWSFTKKEDRQDVTQLQVKDNIATIIVGDSKEGFQQAINLFLEIHTAHHYRTIDTIVVDYDYVRPDGERLLTFGGKASGYKPLQRMFMKTKKVIDRSTGKLKPIDVMDIITIIAENVVSGAVRRSACIMFIDPDDEELKTAKSNIYVQDSKGDWKANEELLHRMMSNNSVIYHEKPSRETLHNHFKLMKNSGEPALINGEEGKRRYRDFKGLNPCLHGDNRILTPSGYVKISDMPKDKPVELVDNNGNTVKGKVWSNGIKEYITLSRRNAVDIKCTPDHRFMTIDGNEVEAKDLVGKRIMPFLRKPVHGNDLFVKLGFIQGDGTLTQGDGKRVIVNIGENDDDVLEYFGLERSDSQSASKHTYNLSRFHGYIDKYGLKREALPLRDMPDGFEEWNKEQSASFLHGLYSANGSVIGGKGRGRVALKSTNHNLVKQVSSLLKRHFDIRGYITINKPTETKHHNGVYTSKESYDLNISRYEGRLKFYENIGFIHKYKMNKLKEYLITQSPSVHAVKPGGEEEVFDFSIPTTHWGVINGVITHNCAEILLDDKQVCNLSVVNMSAFADDNGICDYKGLGRAQTLSARAGYRMTLPDLELKEWDIKQKEHRLTGCSLTGWLDFVEKAEIDFEEQTLLLDILRENAHEANKAIAKEHNLNESTNVTAIKPDGTMSLVFGGVSAGVHASHSPHYIRRIRISASDPLVKVCDDLGWTIKNEVGQTDENVNTKVIEFPVRSSVKRTKDSFSAVEQLETYKMFQEYYTDQNTSITVTVKEDEWDDVEEWMWNNWDSYVGISFLPSDGGFYQLMPYEEITEEEYAVAKKGIKPFNPNLLKKYEGSLQEYESIEVEQETDPECVNGVCPIR